MIARDVLRIAGGYAVMAALYILLSDRFVHAFWHDAQTVYLIQLWKGFGFVLLTALVLAALLLGRGRSERGRYRALFDNQRAAMLVTDPLDGAIVDANPAAAEFYGWPLPQLLSMRLADINTRAPHRYSTGIAQAALDGGSVFHQRHRHANGGIRDVEVHSGPIELDGRTLLLSIVHDETERLRSEHELRRLNRVHALHSKTSQLILRASSRAEFLQSVCEIAVRHGGFLSCWVGMRQADGALRETARSGDDGGHGACGPAGDGGLDGPARRALLGTHQVARQDAFAATGVPAWQEAAAQHPHVGSSAAFPLRFGGEVIGTLNLQASDNDAFNGEELASLDEMAANVSFGLDNLHRVAALHTTEAVVEASPVVLFRWAAQPDWPVEFVSQNVARWGYAPASLLSGVVTFSELVHPEDRERVADEVRRHTDEGRTDFEQNYRIVTADGEERWVDDRTTVERNAAGVVLRFQGAISDVTRQRRAETALRQLTQRLHHYLAVSPTVIYSLIPRGDAVETEWVSDNVIAQSGYPMAEVLAAGWWEAHVHPQDRQAVRLGWQAVFGGGNARQEYRFVCRDGSVIWVLDEMRLVRSEWGPSARIVGSWTNITENKRAEVALRESAERLELALKAGDQGIFDLNVQTGEATVSPEYATMLGHDPATFRETNADWIARLHPDDAERVSEVYRDYIAGRVPEYRVEFRQRVVNGDWKWILSLGKLVERDANGAPLRMIGTHTDITVLKESEAHYRRMFLANPHPMWVYDVDTLRFLAVNDAAVRQYGYSAAEFLHMTIADIRPREELPRLHAYIEAHPEQDVDDAGVWRHRRRDGSLVDSEISAHRIDYEGRRAEVVLAHDVTDRLRAERERDSAEEKFRGLVEQSLVGVFIVRDGVVEYSNPRAQEIFGYEPDEMQRPLLTELVAATDRDVTRRELARLLAGEIAVARLDFTGLRKNGKTVMVGAQATLAELEGQPVVIGVLQDITDKFRAEQAEQLFIQRLQRAMTGTVDAIAQMMDLRDPYTSGHERRVGEISAAIAAEMGLDAHCQQGLRIAGSVHDVGKITVPAEILSKPGRISAVEFEIIKTHAEQGYQVLKGIDFPWPVAEVARQHHERMDGSGYPRGLRGEEILLEARILSVADVVESMASHRPYRPTLGADKALEEIERNAGKFYDADVAAACLRLFREKNYSIPA